MNGRVYDPTIGQFLSPDNYVQLPDASLGFNRYSYCLNNPLIYTDPDGEWIGLVIGAVVGGYLGGVVAEEGEFNPGQWAWNETTWKGIGVGLVSGALLGGAVELLIAGEIELSLGASTPSGKATIDVINDPDLEFRWTTSAGGGGSLDLTQEEYDRSLTASTEGMGYYSGIEQVDWSDPTATYYGTRRAFRHIYHGNKNPYQPSGYWHVSDLYRNTPQPSGWNRFWGSMTGTLVVSRTYKSGVTITITDYQFMEAERYKYNYIGGIKFSESPYYKIQVHAPNYTSRGIITVTFPNKYYYNRWKNYIKR